MHWQLIYPRPLCPRTRHISEYDHSLQLMEWLKSGLILPPSRHWASLVVHMVKNLPTMQDTWVRCLGQEDPLEKGMTSHSSVLAWRIPWTEESGSYSPWVCRESDTTEWLTLSLSDIEEWMEGSWFVQIRLGIGRGCYWLAWSRDQEYWSSASYVLGNHHHKVASRQSLQQWWSQESWT